MTAAAVAARVTGSTVFWGRYTNWLLLLLLLLLLREYTAGTVTGRVSLLLVGLGASSYLSLSFWLQFGPLGKDQSVLHLSSSKCLAVGWIFRWFCSHYG